MKLKVAILSGAYPDTTFLTLLTRKLVENNIDVHVYGKLVRKSKEDKGIKFHTYSSKNKLLVYLFLLKYCCLNFIFNLKKMLLFFKIIKKDSLHAKYKKALIILPILYHKPDIIHLQWLKSFEIFKGLEDIIKSKLIVSLRGSQLAISSFIYAESRKITIEATDRADKIHSISDDLSNQLLEINPAVSDKIVKINPAIDLNLFATSELFLNQDKKSPIRIVSVCRLAWNKGLIYSIAALKLVWDKNIDFEYIIIGDGGQKEELSYIIHDLGLSTKVTLMGNQSQNKVREVLLASDVFLLPSVQEGFSNAVIEAQAIGLPCLVSDAGGLEENIENGKTGFVFKRRDVEDLALLIERFDKMSTSDYIDMKTNAVERCRLKYDVNNQIELFKTLYLDA